MDTQFAPDRHNAQLALNFPQMYVRRCDVSRRNRATVAVGSDSDATNGSCLPNITLNMLG